MDKKLPSPNFLSAPSDAKNGCQLKSTKNFLMPGLVGSGIPQQSATEEKPKDEFAAPTAPITKQRHVHQKTGAPHFSSPEGMLMPSSMQPPPMYGPRGPTIPPKYLPDYQKKTEENHKNETQSWCDVCDCSFASKAELEEHKNEHEVCEIDGCSFVGGIAALESHIVNTHNSGIYDKIKKFSTPEEIAMWREDRRKKYPTSTNIELRRKFQEAKMKRGEKIEKKKSRFGRKEDRRPMTNSSQSAGQKVVLRKPRVNSMKGKKSEAPKEKSKIIKKKLETEPESIEPVCSGKLPLFKGTSILEDYARPKVESVKPNPLANLLGMYGSDDDASDSESDEENCEEQNNLDENLVNKSPEKQVETQLEEDNFNKTTATEIKDKEKNNIQNDLEPENSTEVASSDDEMPEEIPAKRIKENFDEDTQQKTVVSQPKSFTELDKDPKQLTATNAAIPEDVQAKKDNKTFEEGSSQNKSAAIHKSKRRTRRKRSNNNEQLETQPKTQNKPKTTLLNYSKLRTSRQNTMLEKLLEPEIRHERNVLLQCVRYVVENKFFGIGGKKPS